jgi:hypothetical protein
MEKRSASQVIEDLKNIPYEVSFSRESVIEIIESIECPEPQKPQGKVDYDQISKDVTEYVIDAIQNMDADYIADNPCFRLLGNEIILDSFDINTRDLRNTLKQFLSEYFEELKEKEQEEEEND